jgi:hypothetical protein
MSAYKEFIVAAILLATAAGLHAQGTATLVRPRVNVSFAEPWRPANGAGETRVVGQVIDIRQAPVAQARVQLRNLGSGLVQQHDETDANGEYAFSVENPGTYVVEMIMVDGHVIALSNAGALARFETLQTIVQLPGRWDSLARAMVMSQNVVNFVGMSAATTMTAQTVAIALEQSIQPVDSGEPVSPFKP